jgi:hypothetical protein
MGPWQYLKEMGQTAISAAVGRWAMIYRNITVVVVICIQIKRLKKTVKMFGTGEQNKYRELKTEHLKQMVSQISPHIIQNIFKKMCLTLSLLMSYIYGALSKARNLTSYIYIWTRFFTGNFAS